MDILARKSARRTKVRGQVGEEVRVGVGVCVGPVEFKLNCARTPEAMSRRPSSRAVCPQDTTVDNSDDACLAATYSARMQ